MDRLPIVYIRGFAGPTSGIDRQVDDPFYGFNDGATHVRVGGDGDPRFYQFEGPLLRLMTDESYRLLVHGDQHAFLQAQADGKVPAESLWVYRFYDQAATTFAPQPHRSLLSKLRHDAEAKVAAPAGFNIEEAARGLYDFVELVLLKTGAPAIYLVAHSMGGLIARCMIQKISQQYDEAAQRQRTPANQLVRKLFTFGTPHGGIQFEIAALDWAMETFGPAGGDIFSPRLMYGYLDKDANWGDEAPDGWDPRVIPPELFDTSSVFCLVGTDPADYGAPRVVVGPKSDGLVDITNAYVRGANRSFVHRSHSGRYGEVNSEEGYQNLRRFLFGNYRVAVDLRGITLPDRQDGRVWQADVRLSVRGLPIVMHEQQAAHYCPIQLAEEIERHHDTADAPVPLTTVFLLDPNRAVGYGDADRPPRARYSLSMRVYHLTEVSGGFLWRHHLEQVADWEDTLIVDVGRRDDDPETALRAWTAWNSAVAGAIDDYDPIANALPEDQRADAHFTADGGEMHAEVALPAVAAPILGQAAKLRLTVTRVGEFVAPAQPGN